MNQLPISEDVRRSIVEYHLEQCEVSSVRWSYDKTAEMVRPWLECDIHPNTIRAWVRKFQAGQPLANTDRSPKSKARELVQEWYAEMRPLYPPRRLSLPHDAKVALVLRIAAAMGEK